AFSITLPPELVYDTPVALNLDGITFTISVFDYLARGGLAGLFGTDVATAVATSLANQFVSALRTNLLRMNPYALVTTTSLSGFSARLRYDNFFSFIFSPKVEITISDFDVQYQFGHLEPRSRLIQPPSITVDPLPFAFHADPVYDLNAIQGRLIIVGGDQFESAG